MVPTARTLGAVIAPALLVLAGCGEEEPSRTAAEAPTAESSSASAEESATPSPEPSTSASPQVCEPPARDVEYTSGSATLDVTSGPDTGHYELPELSGYTSGYAASDREIVGRWISADRKVVLFIDIEGADPCQPDAFTSIGTRGQSGPLFIDPAHTGCSVEVSSLSDAGVEGTFSCSGLMGGGEGLERDAHGTFSLAP